MHVFTDLRRPKITDIFIFHIANKKKQVVETYLTPENRLIMTIIRKKHFVAFQITYL